jgi:arginine deiminase
MTERLERAVAFGVDSEVGTLRKVIVHRPGLEHTRRRMRRSCCLTM